MMKHKILFGLCLMGTSLLAHATPLQSLRGHAAIDEAEPIPLFKPWQKDQRPIQRDYVQQPPLVPHATDSYVVNLKFNKCLTCHSWANYKTANATKIPTTHFDDRDGVGQGNVAARRYFCSQCHVPQADAPPLVENTFSPIPTLRRQ
jgi:nitrate reductase (cytochrome), electron transfer subunit